MALPATLLLLILPLPVGGDPSQDARLFQVPQGDPEAVNLGVHWGSLTPTGVIHINLSTVTSAMSSFEFRTRDAEGPIFSGDTGSGDWFVLGLRRGRLEVQLQNSVANLSATAGPRLDDGHWHRLSVSSEGHAVLLELDGAPALTLRHVAAPLAHHPLPTMRIAPGGLLWSPIRLLDPLDLAMDGCMRRWDWLNQTVAWGQGSAGGPPKPCFRTLLPGSFFAGGGAIFTTADLVAEPPAPEGGWELVVELGVRAPPQTGLILAVTDANASLVLSLSLAPTALSLHLGQGVQLSLPLPPGCLCPVDAVGLHVGPASLSLHLGAQHACAPLAAPPLHLHTAWTSPHGRLHLGALPEAAEGPGPFQGCLHGLRVQGQELDLDAALAKSNAIWAHSCPGNGGHRVGCTCP